MDPPCNRLAARLVNAAAGTIGSSGKQSGGTRAAGSSPGPSRARSRFNRASRAARLWATEYHYSSRPNPVQGADFGAVRVSEGIGGFA